MDPKYLVSCPPNRVVFGLRVNVDKQLRPSCFNLESQSIGAANASKNIDTATVHCRWVTRRRKVDGEQWVCKSEDMSLNAIWRQPNITSEGSWRLVVLRLVKRKKQVRRKKWSSCKVLLKNDCTQNLKLLQLLCG